MEEDNFIPLLDLASSLESFYAFIKDEEEQERREIVRAAIQVGVKEIDLISVKGSENGLSQAEAFRDKEYLHKELLEGKADEEIEEVEAGIEVGGSIEIGALEGHVEEEYLHKGSSLERDTSMSNINNKAFVQAQL